MTGPIGSAADPNLTPAEIAWLAWQAWGEAMGGFQDIPIIAAGAAGLKAEVRRNVIIATAIAITESSGRYTRINNNPATGDLSYGLYQINMIGGLGPDRRKRYGLSKNDDLLNPMKNTSVAHAIWKDNGQSFKPWSTYTSGLYLLRVPLATQAADNPKQPKNIGQSAVETQVGGKLIDVLFDPIINFIKGLGLQLAGFIGGGVLIILAIVLYVKRGGS